jgi:hypothetical protein
MEILQTARSADLPNWYVGAGVIRNAVWDCLHGYEVATAIRDVDVAFFDLHDMSGEREERAAQFLRNQAPTYVWEPINQARVHLWYQQEFGVAVCPLLSSEDAIDTWPETATCVGVRLLEDDTLIIYAPYGLADLFNMVLRRNPKRVSLEQFRRRAWDKRIAEKWPQVTIIDE